MPAEHDQPLVTARLNSSLGCERHVRTWVEVKVHLAYLGNRGDGIRLTCNGWLNLGLVTNLIIIIIIKYNPAYYLYSYLFVLFVSI